MTRNTFRFIAIERKLADVGPDNDITNVVFNNFAAERIGRLWNRNRKPFYAVQPDEVSVLAALLLVLAHTWGWL